MTWRERLKPASFKGVAFFVDGYQAAMGRRVSVRRLAGRPGSVQQDMDEEPDQFDVEAFLVGDDFDLDREALEVTLRSKGPGQLVLPSRGELWARVTRGPSTSEQRKRLGVCAVRFSVVVEDRTTRVIQVSTDTAGKFKVAATDLETAAETDFLDIFDAAGLPGKYITKGASAVEAVASAMRQVMGKINATINPLQDLSASIDNLGNAASDLVSSPAQLMAAITGVTTSTFGLIATTKAGIDRTTGLNASAQTPYDQALDARTAFLVAKDLNGLGDDEPADGAVELADQNAKNVRAIYRLARASAMAAQANIYATSPLDSALRALSIMEGLNAEIDALQLYSSSDDLFLALASLRAAAVDHLTQTASQLPKAITYLPKQEVPALLLAHTFYGDARLESEIVARNVPRYPLFLGDPDAPLELLESIE